MNIKIAHSEVHIVLQIVICSLYKWISLVLQEMAKRGLLAKIFHRSDPNDRDQLRIREENDQAKVFIEKQTIASILYKAHMIYHIIHFI